MRRFAAGLALLLVLSGCTASSAPSTTTTTAAPGTTATSSTTPTAPPTTTTTSTTVPATTCAGGVEVRSLPREVLIPGLTATVRVPQLADSGRLYEFDLNDRLAAFVEGRLAAALPREGAYSLDFEVICLHRDNWGILSIVFHETATAAGGPTGIERAFAFPISLVTGEALAAGSMFSAAGLPGLLALISGQTNASLGEDFCCLSLDALEESLAVTDQGLLVYLDSSDGLPAEAGPLELVLPWAEVTPFIDLNQPHLGSFAVANGRCSALNQEWVLEEQPGLPAAVAAKRAAIFAAAAACNYQGLEDLAGEGEGFAGPIGAGVHPGTAEHFRDGESYGDADLWWLLTTLNLPYAEKTYDYGDGTSWTGYVWPAAEGVDWDQIPPAQAAVMRELYAYQFDGYLGEEWDQGRFFGFHVDINPEGTWVWVGFTPA